MINILTNTYHTYQIPESPSGIVELDMGCGKGRFTLALAERYRDRCILGNDLMLGRLRRLQKKVVSRKLDNVELLRASSLELAAFQLPIRSIDRIHLLCPDPWPKDKHEIKRLVCSDFLCRLRRILKVGGILHMATDHAPYFESWLRLIGKMSWFERTDGASDDVADIQTDFEQLWLSEGKVVQHVNFRMKE